MEILTKIKQFVKEKEDDIILLIGVILISFLSFAAGYIAAKNQEKEPLELERLDEREEKFISLNSPAVGDENFVLIFTFIP